MLPKDSASTDPTPLRSNNDQMPTSRLGANGPMVSKVGLGTAALGRPGYLNEGHDIDLAGRTDRASMLDNAFAVFDAAITEGITYFDTARSYGDAERFIRAWVDSQGSTGSQTRMPVIGSKWGYTYVADWRTDAEIHEVKDHSFAAFKRQNKETGEALGADVSLYQIHSLTPESPALTDRALHTALKELKASEMLIGFSSSGPNQAETIRKAMDIQVDSQPLFEVVQATWNILEPSAGPALQEASDAGLGVIVKEAVANGRLTDRGDYANQLDSSDVSPDALAMAAAMSQPFTSVVLSGATTVDQLRSNAKATSISPTAATAAADIEPIPADEYWSQRSDRVWR